jgi:hypothetical protein
MMDVSARFAKRLEAAPESEPTVAQVQSAG